MRSHDISIVLLQGGGKLRRGKGKKLRSGLGRLPDRLGHTLDQQKIFGLYHFNNQSTFERIEDTFIHASRARNARGVPETRVLLILWLRRKERRRPCGVADQPSNLHFLAAYHYEVLRTVEKWRGVLTTVFGSVSFLALPRPVVGVRRRQVFAMFLSNTLLYWLGVSLLRRAVAHCLNCKHCKCADSIIVALHGSSSDAVHELRILLQDMQGRSAAEGFLRASKGFVWLLISMQHISSQCIISRAHSP